MSTTDPSRGISPVADAGREDMSSDEWVRVAESVSFQSRRGSAYLAGIRALPLSAMLVHVRSVETSVSYSRFLRLIGRSTLTVSEHDRRVCR